MARKSKRFKAQLISFMSAAAMAISVMQIDGYAVFGVGNETVSEENAEASLTKDGTTVYIDNLEENLKDSDFAAEYSGGEIKLLKDIQSTYGEISIGTQGDYSFTLDLNGHTVDGSITKQGGMLTVTDSSEDKTGTVNGRLYFSDGKLTINGGRFIGTDKDYCAALLYNCTALINDGTFESWCNGVHVRLSSVTINGGEFRATGEKPDDAGEGVISGLRFEFDDYGTPKIKLAGGTFYGIQFAVEIEHTGVEIKSVRDLLGYSESDSERFAFYIDGEPVLYNSDILKGTTLKGPLTVKKCEHENAVYTQNNPNADDTHKFSCNICGADNLTSKCVYEFTRSDDTTHTFTCKYCRYEKTEQHGSTADNAATCTKKACCDICEQEYGDYAEHDLKKIDTVSPTCTEYGSEEYWICSKCGKMFSDEGGEHEIEAVPKIDPAGHKAEIIPGKPAACESDGWIEGSKCSVCGTILTPCEAIKALGHNYDYNKWISDSDNHWHKCTRCNGVTDVTAHISDGGTVEKEATKDETGLKVFKCEDCQYVMKTETIPVINEPSQTSAPEETTAEETTAAEATTAEETTVAEITTITEATTAAEATTVTEATTAAEETTATNAAIVTEEPIVTEATIITEATTVTEAMTATEGTTAAESATVTEETAITEELTEPTLTDMPAVIESDITSTDRVSGSSDSNTGNQGGNPSTGAVETIVPLAAAAAFAIAAAKCKRK